MSFDQRDIHVAMDVYTGDNHYLGTVLKVIAEPAQPQVPMPPTLPEASLVNGELLGPMPTLPIGNAAALKQGAAAGYGTAPDAPPLGNGVIVVGRWLGLRGRRTIPLQDVQTVSLERIVLKFGKQ